MIFFNAINIANNLKKFRNFSKTTTKQKNNNQLTQQPRDHLRKLLKLSKLSRLQLTILDNSIFFCLDDISKHDNNYSP